jgi:hypothetical protein
LHLYSVLHIEPNDLKQHLEWDAEGQIGKDDFLLGMRQFLAEEKKKRHLVMRQDKKHHQESLTEAKVDRLLQVRAAFDSADTNNDGLIQFEELREMVERMGRCISDEELRLTFSALDGNDSGTIEWVEFLYALGSSAADSILGWESKASLEMPHINLTRGDDDMMFSNAIWFNYVQNCVAAYRKSFAKSEPGEMPNRKKAREYFEKVVRPRKRMISNGAPFKGSGNQGRWRLAAPGEDGKVREPPKKPLTLTPTTSSRTN